MKVGQIIEEKEAMREKVKSEYFDAHNYSDDPFEGVPAWRMLLNEQFRSNGMGECEIEIDKQYRADGNPFLFTITNAEHQAIFDYIP